MFVFQRFTVHDDQCAHKVGTDGILLGAWAGVGAARRILDVGTGSGLVALMLAQRACGFANDDRGLPTIDAIDENSSAVKQAGENFARSPWHDRLRSVEAAWDQFAGDSIGAYDLIVANPPFFPAGAPDAGEPRTAARLDRHLTVRSLLAGAAQALRPGGRCCLVWPYDRLSECLESAADVGFSCTRLLDVCPLPREAPIRVLLQLEAATGRATVKDTLVVELSKHVYSDAFRKLTAGFYL